MATVKEMKAAARSRAGKGAARAERRAGRVPGVIYGDGKPPLNVSVDHAELKQRIYAGHFLTTVYDLDVDLTGLEINYSKHLSDIQIPANVKVLEHGDITLVTIVPPSGYAEEMKQAAAAATAAAEAATAAAAAPAAPTGAPGANPAPAAPAGGKK